MFVCLLHGKYKERIESNECPKCSGNSTGLKNFVEQARKIHKRRYDYSDFIFVDLMTPGSIRCRKHGVFVISPAVHIRHKMGCPTCSGSVSKGEIDWLNYLEDKLKIKFERNNILIIGKKSIRPDGINREKKIVAEYYGNYWHGDLKKYAANDRNHQAKKTFGQLYENTLKREKLIKEAGYKLITIWEDDWLKLKKK